MAEESTRSARGRKQATESDEAATSARKKAAEPAAKTTPKGEKDKTAAKPAKPKPRRRRVPAGAAEPTPQAIAEHAYLLWERGEPGGETEHWLRAEAELRAA
jgi:hypothetical protein